MITLMRDGGFPMFFLLAFGLAALAFAVRFAVAPSQRGLKTAAALAAATGFTAITGVCAALAKVGKMAPGIVQRHPENTLGEIVLLGFAESLSPAILGSTMLSLVALIVALGVWRQNPS
jgi:hypothetical protein